MATMKLNTEKIRFVIIFSILVLIFTSVIYAFWPFPIKQWYFKGTIFEFRSDLKQATTVPTSTADCKLIYQTINNPLVADVTFYANNQSSNAALAVLEATDMARKLSIYYSLEPTAHLLTPQIYGDVWNETTNTMGSLDHVKIFIVTPPQAGKFDVEFFNNSVWINGRNLLELDLATDKAMMCMFGMNLTYGLYSSSPVFGS